MMEKLSIGTTQEKHIERRLKPPKRWQKVEVVDEFEGKEVYVLGLGNFKIENGRRIWLTAPPASYYQENRSQ